MPITVRMTKCICNKLHYMMTHITCSIATTGTIQALRTLLR